jgi:histidyl-tRNA synthetase
MDRLPGFRDFYPEPLPNKDAWSCDARNYIFGRWRETARRYGFREYDGPPLETLELYTAKSGDEIVGQLYNFVDKGGREVALRPEMTPTVARMIAAHERNYKKPIKWFSIPQLYRYERMQKGRLREHFQLNADIFGESDPAADAELICLLIDSLRSLGLTADDFVIRLSSRNAWQGFFEARCPDAARIGEFYQIVDKLEREDPAVSKEKLNSFGIQLDVVQEFIRSSPPTPGLQAIVDSITARGLAEYIKLDYSIIRGLAYYTGVVFEAFDRKGLFRAIAGGGRYDNLIKLVSGGKMDMPALGFGMGDVVLLELLKDRGCLPNLSPVLDAFVLIEDEALRRPSLDMVQRLRNAGLAVEYSLTPAKPDKQFKRATELGAARTVRLERAADGQILARLKTLASREEKVVSPDAVVELLRL